MCSFKPAKNYNATTQRSYATDLNEYARIGLNHSCRHSAIRLVEEASKCPNLGQGISSLFFNYPPLTAVFSAGKVKKNTSYFYILPLPPTSFASLTPVKLRIITKLYQRLDEIILNEQANPITIRKFQQLKKLYNNLTHDEHTSIMDIMNGIEEWAVANKTLIATHRRSHWIPFQTATQKMFAEFHHEFVAMQECPQP